MTESRTPRPEPRDVDCSDCQAGPATDHIRIVAVRTDGQLTGTWHLPDCPQYTVERILLEDSTRRAALREWSEILDRSFPPGGQGTERAE